MSLANLFNSNTEKSKQNKENSKQNNEITKTMNNNIKTITKNMNKNSSFLDSILSNVKTISQEKVEDLEESTKKSKSVKDNNYSDLIDFDSETSSDGLKSVKKSENVIKDDSFKVTKEEPIESIKKSEKVSSIDRIDFTSNVEKSKESSFKYNTVFSSIKSNIFKTFSFLTFTNFWFIIKIFIIIIIISTLGFNIFLYLAEGTDFLQYIINKYAKFIPVGILNTMKMSAVGIKGTAETTETNLNNLQENVKKNKATQHIWEKKNKDLEKSLNKDSKLKEKEKKEKEEKERIRKERLKKERIRKERLKKERLIKKNKQNTDNQKNNFPKPFSNQGSKKRNGWCFIGNDRNGLPHCAKINDITMCNSGNISPTREICMNPLLRN